MGRRLFSTCLFLLVGCFLHIYPVIFLLQNTKALFGNFNANGGGNTHRITVYMPEIGGSIYLNFFCTEVFDVAVAPQFFGEKLAGEDRRVPERKLLDECKVYLTVIYHRLPAKIGRASCRERV